MAGKNVGPWQALGTPFTGHAFDPRMVKAYAEGRENKLVNGHPVGSDARAAYQLGFNNRANSSQQFETAIE